MRTTARTPKSAQAAPARKKAAVRRRSPYGWLTPKQAIPRMVKRIVKHFDPERIILFGSQARGDAGPDSDVDLLVVMEVLESKRRIEVAIRVALRDILFPKDIIVSTPEEFSWRNAVIGTIEHMANSDGRVLHARR